MARRAVPIAAVILAIALAVTAAIAFNQRDDLNAARERADRLQEILAKTLERLDELERQESTIGDGGLFGDLGDGGLDDFGASTDLFGDLDIGALSECLGAGDLLEGGDDLFGGGGQGLDRLLEDLEKGSTSNDPSKAFEDLLGGLGSATGGAEEGNARSQIRTITEQVEDIRKLEFRSKVKVRFLRPKAVAARAARLMLADYPADVAASEGRVLAALGAIPPDTDLRQAAKELLESQVAGFYVPAKEQLVVPSRDPGRPLSANEKIVLAHELEHAVADQQLGLPVPERPDPSEADETLAALSVAEGDATLVMQRYALQAIPIFEQLTMMSDPALAQAQDALAETPHFLLQQLLFPYTSGLEFDCGLYTTGGWRAVNRAYEDPPTTTAQVMFPERYAAGEAAIEVRDPSAPGSGWTKDMESTFGAAHLLWLFQAPGGDLGAALDDPEGAARAWAGGEVHLFTRGDSSAVALVLAQRSGESGLCESVVGWYDSAFEDEEVAPDGAEELARDGELQDALVWCSGDEVRVGIGPDLATARELVE
jgi:hypothetical protein